MQVWAKQTANSKPQQTEKSEHVTTTTLQHVACKTTATKTNKTFKQTN